MRESQADGLTGALLAIHHHHLGEGDACAMNLTANDALEYQHLGALHVVGFAARPSVPSTRASTSPIARRTKLGKDSRSAL